MAATVSPSVADLDKQPTRMLSNVSLQLEKTLARTNKGTDRKR